MPIVGGLDIHRKQITFDYLDTVTGQVCRGQVSPADRGHLRAWLARFADREDVAFAVEGCTGWRYVAEELAAAGVAAHLAEPADTAFARSRKRHAKTGKTVFLSFWRYKSDHSGWVIDDRIARRLCAAG
jgi:transposase